MKALKPLTFIFLSLLIILPAMVSANPEGSVAIEGVSKYLWRGQSLSEDFSIQPDISLTYKNFSMDFWGSFDVATKSMGEADTTLSHSISISKLGVSYGLIYYTFPSKMNLATTSEEVFLELGIDTFLTPTLSYYYDFGGGKGGYLECAVEFPFKLFFDFTIKTSLGYNFGQWGYTPSPTVLGIPVSIEYPIGDFGISLGGFFQIAFNNQYKNDGFCSITVQYNF